jgi:hypothetical protein
VGHAAPVITERFDRALAYAVEVHRDDTRKGPLGLPYVGHVLGVCGIVLSGGGTEDQALAALLHDTAEDHGGEDRLDDLAAHFGPEVAALVRDLSDSLVDTALAEKAPWWERKVRYVAHAEELAARRSPAVLVSAADKLDNLRATLADYRALTAAGGDPATLWSVFNAQSRGRAGWVWYHRRLADTFAAAFGPDDDPQRRVVDEMQATLHAMTVLITAHEPTADLAADAAEADALEAQTRAALGTT